MPPTPIRYRRCRPADLVPAVRLIMASVNDLRCRTGKEPIRRQVRQAPPSFAHLRSCDPDLFYCAWAGRRMVGFAGAIERGAQWYLAWLFVHPRYQGRGVGRGLIEHVWSTRPGVTHGLATFTYNPQAVSLYSRFGMTPRGLFSMMRAPGASLRLPPDPGLQTHTGLGRGDLGWIHELEGRIRGYPHPPEWRFWSASPDYRIQIFRRRGRRVGYSMINTLGEIAPAGAESSRDLPAVMDASLRLAVEQPFGRNVRKPQVQLLCPTGNAQLYLRMLEIGLRNLELLVLMADADYGDCRRYVPAHLAIY